MKKKITTLTMAAAFILSANLMKSQTALQLSGNDCNGVSHDLYADLDAGKAVILHFFMPNCGSCPPPAQKIQAMANNILAIHPGMITAYAMPFNNSTTCASTASWVTNSGLSLYAPFDSGATQVAHYGGFGMPTVVLLGGTDHHVMFSTQSFSTSDTTQMRDSILALLSSGSSGLNLIEKNISSINVYPNPANENVQFELNVTKPTNIKIEILNLLGDVVSEIYDAKTYEGILKKQISTTEFSNGIYFMKVTVEGNFENYKFTVAH